MPVQKLRRIGPVVGESLYDQIESRTFHQLTTRRYVDEVERKHPDLVVRDGTAILAGDWHGGAKLIYGFESERAFCERFPRMFEKLLPKIRRELRADSLRLRLSYAPARPLVEPVLKQQMFTPSRDWMEFSLSKATKLPAASA